MSEASYPSSSETPFEQLVQRLLSLPFWIKQVVYALLKADLEQSFTPQSVSQFQPADLLQWWRPTLTLKGDNQLYQANKRYNTPLLNLLYQAGHKRTLLDLCLINGWPLEMACITLLEALGQNLIEPPQSIITLAALRYLGNATRIGEYLVELNRLSPGQLEQALKTQQYSYDSLGIKTGLADIMINLDFIKRQDCESILFLKEESKKPLELQRLLALMQPKSTQHLG